MVKQYDFVMFVFMGTVDYKTVTVPKKLLVHRKCITKNVFILLKSALHSYEVLVWASSFFKIKMNNIRSKNVKIFNCDATLLLSEALFKVTE